MSRDSEETRRKTDSTDETPDGFPICQWCGGAITKKDDLVVAAQETGAPPQIAPVGYTAPRTFATYHRSCHPDFVEEEHSEQASVAPTLWTPENIAIIGVTVCVILIVLVFAFLPQ